MICRVSPRADCGFVALVVVILLGLIVALGLANLRALRGLQSEVRLLEKRQQIRWERLGSTNRTAVAHHPATETVGLNP